MRSFVAGMVFLATLGGAAMAVPVSAEAPPKAFSLAKDGHTLIHQESGTKLPETLAGFRRVGEKAFDGSGQYVGVAYADTLPGGGKVSLTLAIVHIKDMTAQQHFIIAKPMVLKGLGDVKTVSEGPYDRPGKGADGYLGLYDAQAGGKPVSVGLWTIDRGYWALRGRAEFPQDKRAEAQAAIDRFVDAFTALDQPYNHRP
ncbi:MAG TPA: hypothetical protein VF503_22505 [Sphingobium sp.]|uniref:hypothetical protein n=1 Tax=Sphingobium sp. TaxID=1912891 RepID=UPI002ED57585